MKYFMLVAALAVSGYFAYQELTPPPPPPPPPPAKAAPVISPEDLAKVVHSSSDPNMDVRWQALLFLNKLETPEMDDIIFTRLHNDPKSELRQKIVSDILASRRGPTITQNLIWALTDKNAKVRVAVLQALSQVGDIAAAPNVTAALKDPDGDVRQQALKTLNDLQEIEAQENKKKQEAYQQSLKKKKWFDFENY